MDTWVNCDYRLTKCVSLPELEKLKVRPGKAEEPKACFAKDEESLKSSTNTISKQLELLEEEAYQLVMDNSHYLADSNIVGLSVGLKEKDGKETEREALIFDVVKKMELEKISKAKIIPEKVRLKKTESGTWETIETDVVETGQLVFNRAQGGSAICAEGTPDKPLLGPCTLGAILPNIIYGTEQSISGRKQMQLITSAHLIDYEEQHITKQLRYLEMGRFLTIEREQANEEFLHPNQALFPVTGFHPVKKYRKGDMESPETAVHNQFDVLWANVTDPERISETVLGQPHCGIAKAEYGESFTFTGIATRRQWNGRVGRPVNRVVVGQDSEGGYRTYWKNLMRYKLPTRPGDSGAALLSSTGKIIGLHTFGTENGNYGYACRLYVDD